MSLTFLEDFFFFCVCLCVCWGVGGRWTLSRMFHLYRADRSSKENRKTRGKTTWPSISRTWLSHMSPERGPNHSYEKPNELRVSSLIYWATGACLFWRKSMDRHFTADKIHFRSMQTNLHALVIVNGACNSPSFITVGSGSSVKPSVKPTNLQTVTGYVCILVCRYESGVFCFCNLTGWNLILLSDPKASSKSDRKSLGIRSVNKMANIFCDCPEDCWWFELISSGMDNVICSGE